MGKTILIIADIEGSSGCLTRASAKFLGRRWPGACREMSKDVRVLAEALIRGGAGRICIQDFHRTGYNIFPALMPRQVGLAQGYRPGPVPGMGSPGPGGIPGRGRIFIWRSKISRTYSPSLAG